MVDDDCDTDQIHGVLTHHVPVQTRGKQDLAFCFFSRTKMIKIRNFLQNIGPKGLTRQGVNVNGCVKCCLARLDGALLLSYAINITAFPRTLE